MALTPMDAFLQALSVSKKYTDETVVGGGAIKGKNCTILDIEPVPTGNKITFKWYLDDGTEKTSYLVVTDGTVAWDDLTPEQRASLKGDPGEKGDEGRGIVRSYIDDDTRHVIVEYDDGETDDWGEITTITVDTLDELTDVDVSGAEDGNVLVYDAELEKWVPGQGGGGGDASLETDVTSNLAVGAIASGTTLPEGTTFTEFAQKLLITEIAPTTTFSASGSGVKEVGTSVTPTLTLTINSKGTGTPVAIKFYSGSTLLDTQSYVSGTNTYTYTMESAVTTTTTVKGVLEYKKSDNTDAIVEKSATYTFVMASYYGAVTTAPTTKAEIIVLTKNVKTGRGQTATFTLSNQRSCYCYPASMGNLTSIKDANNFEYLSSYTKTTVAVDGVDYNVYTLTDPVTATGFKQVYA